MLWLGDITVGKGHNCHSDSKFLDSQVPPKKKTSFYPHWWNVARLIREGWNIGLSQFIVCKAVLYLCSLIDAMNQVYVYTENLVWTIQLWHSLLPADLILLFSEYARLIRKTWDYLLRKPVTLTNNSGFLVTAPRRRSIEKLRLQQLSI